MAGIIAYQGISEPAWRKLSARSRSVWRGVTLCICIFGSGLLVSYAGTSVALVLSAASLITSQFVLESQRLLGTIQPAIARARLQATLIVGGTIVVAASGFAILGALTYTGAGVIRLLLSKPLNLSPAVPHFMSVNLLTVISAMMIGHTLFKLARDMRLPDRLWAIPMDTLRIVFVEQRRRAMDSAELILQEFTFIITIYGWAVFAIQWSVFLHDVNRIFTL